MAWLVQVGSSIASKLLYAFPARHRAVLHVNYYLHISSSAVLCSALLTQLFRTMAMQQPTSVAMSKPRSQQYSIKIIEPLESVEKPWRSTLKLCFAVL